MEMLQGRTSIPIRCIVERVASNNIITDKDSLEGNSPSSGGRSADEIGLTTANTGVISSTPTSSSTNINGPAISSSSCSSTMNGVSPTGPTSYESPADLVAAGNTQNSHGSNGCLAQGSVEKDSFAIITSGLLLSDLVRTALQHLGYHSSEILGAKGFIQLRNWKPLTFDQITDSIDATVGDIMGDISSTATLRIILQRPKTRAAQNESDEKFSQLILAHTFNFLANSGCPIDQPLMAAICNQNPRLSTDAELNDETREKFDQWYMQTVFNQYRQMAMGLAAAQVHQQAAAAVVAASTQQHSKQAAATLAALANPNSFNGQASDGRLNLSRRSDCSPSILNLEMNQLSNHKTNHSSHNSEHHSSIHNVSHPHNAHQQPPPIVPPHHVTSHRTSSIASPPETATPTSQSSSSQQQYVRTRIRTSFDPEMELPKLHKWFSENQHPTRPQIQQYVKELNSLESRRGRKPLDVNNVVYWFKNARAAHKRQELKFLNGSNSPSNSNNQILNNVNQDPLDGEGKDLRDSCSEGNGNSHFNGQNMEDMDSDVHDDYADDMDDDCSQISQTLDLSVRPEKRKRSDSSAPSSPTGSTNVNPPPDSVANHSIRSNQQQVDVSLMRTTPPPNFTGSNNTLNNNLGLSSSSTCIINANNNFNVKEDQATEDEEDDSDLDDKDYYMNNNNHKDLSSSTGYSLTSGNAMDTDHSNNGTSQSQPDSPEEGRRVRRSRTFIDPMSEVPRLELWFTADSHPTHSQIVKYTQELNSLPYRLKFPKLESKNIQFWFKNRRAKIKRLSIPGSTGSATVSTTTTNRSSLTSSSLPTQSQQPIVSSVPNISPKCSISSPSPTQSSPNSMPVSSALTIDRLIGH